MVAGRRKVTSWTDACNENELDCVWPPGLGHLRTFCSILDGNTQLHLQTLQWREITSIYPNNVRINYNSSPKHTLSPTALAADVKLIQYWVCSWIVGKDNKLYLQSWAGLKFTSNNQ